MSAADDLIEIQTETGAVIPFEGQPLRFALQQRFTAQVGDTMIVKGFEENGEFKIGQITNLTNGVTVTLRDGQAGAEDEVDEGRVEQFHKSCSTLLESTDDAIWARR